MHIHHGMKLDVDKVIDIFAQMHPRRMQFINVLHEEKEELVLKLYITHNF